MMVHENHLELSLLYRRNLNVSIVNIIQNIWVIVRFSDFRCTLVAIDYFPDPCNIEIEGVGLPSVSVVDVQGCFYS